LDATGDIVGTNGLEERHMEHGMDSHRGGEFETESGFADLGDDWERTEALVVELVAGTSCLDVASEKPHLVTRLELRRNLLDLAVVETSLGC
jgi:hypothetical protein